MASEVILIGGGHSHVQVLEALKAQPIAGANIKVVVDRPIAIYSGMVPGYVAGQYAAEDLEIDVPALCQWAGVECVVAEVTSILAETRKVVLSDGTRFPYDVASVNIGSTVSGLDLAGVREHALPTRPIFELVERTQELAEQNDGEKDSRAFQLVVVGGGAGGVELAFTFRERLLGSGWETIETRLVNAGDRVLEGYPDSLKRRTEQAAGNRDIEILDGRKVVAVEPGAALLDDRFSTRLPFDALLWVTGAVSHPLFKRSGLPIDERGFVRTRSTLQVEDHDELFAVGDCATLIEHPRTPKAGVYAVRQGPFLTENLRSLLHGGRLKTYRPQADFLTLLNLGDGTALGAKWGLSFEGRWVMRLKDSIDRKFMRRFQVGLQEPVRVVDTDQCAR